MQTIFSVHKQVKRGAGGEPNKKRGRKNEKPGMLARNIKDNNLGASSRVKEPKFAVKKV